MPYLVVNLADPADVRSAHATLTGLLADDAVSPQDASVTPVTMMELAVNQLRRKKTWAFLSMAAAVEAPAFSLAELGALIGLTTNKVGSLRAILAKPEQRLGIRFFEPAPDGGVDISGNPRYRMTVEARRAILDAQDPGIFDVRNPPAGWGADVPDEWPRPRPQPGTPPRRPPG